jgi:hypothetical protein
MNSSREAWEAARMVTSKAKEREETGRTPSLFLEFSALFVGAVLSVRTKV